jgi:site-specific DNA-methyltransferase (adenine-specific)
MDRMWTDDDLYAKYGLSSDEIAFIESKIRPMDTLDA